MLYPNLGNSSGLATSTFMEGEHVPTGAYKIGANPRHAFLAEGRHLGLTNPLPSYDTLPLVDMHGEGIRRRELSRRGDDFVKRIAQLGDPYSNLVRFWKRPCRLDTDVSRTDMGTGHERLHDPATRRYLVVAPQMGFSNQLIAILHSAVWAHVLGRILVLPYIIWPRASENGFDRENLVPFHEVFDPTGVLDKLPGLDFVYGNISLMASWHPKRVAVVEPQPIFDKLSDMYFQGVGWTRLERIDLVSYLSSLSTSDTLYQSLGSCGDDVLLLNGLFKNPQRLELSREDHQQLWRSLFQPNPLVNYMIQTAQESLLGGDSGQNSPKSLAYGCLHIRAGDFSAVCSAPHDSAPWLASYYSQGRRCNVSVDDAYQKARSLGMQALVIISDDDTISAQVSDALSGLKVLTDADFQALVEHALPRIRPHPTKQLVEVVAAVVSQHVCAQADHLVLNDFSTFSHSISLYRENKNGVEYW